MQLGTAHGQGRARASRDNRRPACLDLRYSVAAKKRGRYRPRFLCETAVVLANYSTGDTVPRRFPRCSDC